MSWAKRTSWQGMRLPGICKDCRDLVIWNGKVWRDDNRGSTRHKCVIRCGRFMPHAGDRCARLPGHKGYCRSRYAIENARVARGVRAALAGVN